MPSDITELGLSSCRLFYYSLVEQGHWDRNFWKGLEDQGANEFKIDFF